jgi:hypothetical protein
MARREHFGPQLQMFVPAGEFVKAAREERLTFGDDYGQGIESLTEEKVAEAKSGPIKASHGRRVKAGRESQYENIKREGVKEPVTLDVEDDGVPELSDGHHRVLAAADANPRAEIPVVWGGWQGGEFHSYSLKRGDR